MSSSSSPIVVAHVLLRSATGARPGVDVPITAATTAELAPPSGAGQQVADHFATEGFDVTIPHAQSVTIMSDANRFEHLFGVRLSKGTDGSVTARTATGRRKADPTSLPLGSLPVAVRRLIASIGLDMGADLTGATGERLDL